MGQEGHRSVKFFCNAAVASLLQLPRGEEALVGETPSLHHCASLGLGLAVTFVLLVTVPVDYLLQTKVLSEDGILGMDLSYLSFILFIAVIAGMVQLVEMTVEKYSPSLYAALGIFLPLIAVNCAIMGAPSSPAFNLSQHQGLFK